MISLYHRVVQARIVRAQLPPSHAQSTSILCVPTYARRFVGFRDGVRDHRIGDQHECDARTSSQMREPLFVTSDEGARDANSERHHPLRSRIGRKRSRTRILTIVGNN